MRQHIRLIIAGLTIGSFAVPASADDLPRSGDFRIIYTGVNSTPSKPIGIGPNRISVLNSAVMTAVNAKGSGFLHNMAGRCQGLVTMDNEAKTVENHGYCEYTDAAGDRIYESYEYPLQPQGGPVKGTAEWLSGTGKFTGIGGKFTIQNQRVNSLVEGIIQFTGEKNGSYSFQTTASK